MKNWAIILGASSGIGAACAKSLAKKGINIYGIYLRKKQNEIDIIKQDLESFGVDVIFKKGFLDNVKEKGKYFDQGLNKIKNKYPKIIGEIRGIGLIKGLKMLVDNVEFIKKLMNHKMLTVKAEENVIRLFPPLIVENKELDEAINKIEKVCKEMS